MSKTPDPIDVQVGAAVRIRRRWLGLSQTQLANALGITFQQIQKYERGANRISASMLVKIARKLEAPVEHFFKSIAGLEHDDVAETPLVAFASCPGALDVARGYVELDAAQRQAIRQVIAALADLGARPPAPLEDDMRLPSRLAS